MKDNLINAEKWFKLHYISSFIQKNTLYINIEHFELELSKEEIIYRGNEYKRLKKNNLIKTKL